MTARSWLGGSLLAGLLAVTVVGCSAEQKTPAANEDPSSSRSAVSDTSTATSEEDAITAAYKGYFQTVASLGTASGADAKALLEPFASGYTLERTVQVVDEARAKNQQPGGSPTFGELVIEVHGDSATVVECHDGTTEVILDSATGAVVSAGVIAGLRVTLLRGADGTWRVDLIDGADGVC